MKIAIFGTGYVGLVTGSCLAQTGNNVTCLDINRKKINFTKRGRCPIYEPELEELIKKNLKEKRLSFSTDLKKGIKENHILVIAVGTPSKGNGEADLSAVFEVAKQIGKNMNDEKIIVQKSTVPVGTGDKVERIIGEELKTRKKEINFSVVSNPEFLKEGSAVDDFMKPDRIIIGVENEKARIALEKIYYPFMRKGYRVIFMNRASAELTKYAANTMLATRISFINNLSRLAEKVGADAAMIREGIGSDRRIGKDFLYPSVGYGGSCFPKDVKALISVLRKNKVDVALFESVEKINKEQKDWFFDKISKYFKGNLKGKKIAVWGLAFKAETDDVRESAALYFVDKILNSGGIANVFDPEAQENFKKAIGRKARILYAQDEYKALERADALVVLTEWFQFRNPDFDKIKSALKEPVIFDGRNLYDVESLEKMGIKYYCIGRGRKR